MSAVPVVSVITPVYNGESYLEECIQSVLSQTYPHWEYVIADNMSTDGTLAIAERFAAIDRRIRIETATEFVDTYSNHNRALGLIDQRCRYVKFVHADDWLYPDCLERMVAVAECHPSVGIVSAFRLVANHVEHESPMLYPETVVAGREVVRKELLQQAYATGSPSSVLLRADMVRQLEPFFDPQVWHGDTDAAYRALLHSDFGFVHDVLTATRLHLGSLSTFSDRVDSVRTRDGRLLLRYGGDVLTPVEYRGRLRHWLLAYAQFLARQTVLLRGSRQSEFRAFHRQEIEYLLAERGCGPVTRRILSLYRSLLRWPGRAGPDRPSPLAGAVRGKAI